MSPTPIGSSLDLDSWLCRHNGNVFVMLREPPWYGTVCPVVWEDGGSNPASYPMPSQGEVRCCVQVETGQLPFLKMMKRGAGNHRGVVGRK